MKSLRYIKLSDVLILFLVCFQMNPKWQAKKDVQAEKKQFVDSFLVCFQMIQSSLPSKEGSPDGKEAIC